MVETGSRLANPYADQDANCYSNADEGATTATPYPTAYADTDAEPNCHATEHA
jgi:hypothetical protein